MNAVSPNSQSIYPFLRRAELYISSVPEWKGGNSQAGMVQIVGDGTTQTSKIKFEIKKSIKTIANPSYIYVYNLTPDHRAALQKLGFNSGSKIELKIGWSNIPVVTIYVGSLLAAYSERQEADIVTTIVTIPSLGGAVNGPPVSKTYTGSVSSIVDDLVTQMSGVTKGQVNIPANAEIDSQGYSAVGPIPNKLIELGRKYGFNAWVDDGVFNAMPDDTPLSGSNYPLISWKNGYLIRVEPILAEFMQEFNGVMIQSFINPHVQVGFCVKLESEINPTLNGNWMVHNYSANGDTHGSEWTMRIESLKYWQGG